MRARLGGWLKSHGIWLLLGLAAALWLAFTVSLTLMRYWLNYSSAYDFGLFSQMYYYLDKCLRPLTTCERDGLLSHFAVHLSPIFYGLLPIYKLFPRPETLLVTQAIMIISGLIPLCLLGRALRLPQGYILGFGLIYCAYPAFLGGCFYDFHENKLLAPLILWAMYCLESRRFKAMALFLLFILLVKEDAPVYAACIGLYLFLEKRERPLGAAVFLASCLYFCGAVWYLDRFGEGAMVSRFDNYISDPGLGLLSMFKTILIDPAYVISQIASREKLVFMLQMLLPLGFLPLFSLRWQKWVLLIPFVLINLMSNYKYQHSIYFQYTYGSGALLFYLALSNLKALKLPPALRLKETLCACGLACALALTLAAGASKTHYLKQYIQARPVLKEARELLSQIPPEASVRASTFFVPQLSMRDEIYVSDSSHPADYVVLDLRGGYEEDLPEKLRAYRKKGYTAVGSVKDYVALLKAPNASP